MTAPKLLVGLGNPGKDYADTRHNAGAWMVEALSSALKPETKFFGLADRVTVGSKDVRLLVPTTFMNRSGQSVSAMANFFKIAPDEILVAYDELDLEPGIAKFKTGGGHNGHNGLRDIIKALGTNEFHRLRIGIGRPPQKGVEHVLGRPSKADRTAIDDAIALAIAALPLALQGDWNAAMKQLHTS